MFIKYQVLNPVICMYSFFTYIFFNMYMHYCVYAHAFLWKPKDRTSDINLRIAIYLLWDRLCHLPAALPIRLGCLDNNSKKVSTYFCFPSTGVIRLYLSSKWCYFVSSEEKEAQRDEITCLRSSTCVRQNLDLDPDRFKARLHSVALPRVSVSEYTEGGLEKHLGLRLLRDTYCSASWEIVSARGCSRV